MKLENILKQNNCSVDFICVPVAKEGVAAGVQGDRT